MERHQLSNARGSIQDACVQFENFEVFDNECVGHFTPNKFSQEGSSQKRLWKFVVYR